MDGECAGDPFNRNAYLGVASPYGEVRFGRQGALGSGVNGSIFLNSYTVFGNLYKEAQALQIINHQVMRADNMIRYESPDMAGLRLYGEYSNGVDGDDAVPSSQRDRFAALGAQYRRGPLRVVFVADNYFYERGSSPYNRDDSQTYNLGIRWKLDDLTLYGAYQYGHNVEKVGNQMTRHKDTKNTLCGNEGFDSHAVVFGAPMRSSAASSRYRRATSRATTTPSRSRSSRASEPTSRSRPTPGRSRSAMTIRSASARTSTPPRPTSTAPTRRTARRSQAPRRPTRSGPPCSASATAFDKS